ncbi:MAG: response regulator [Syntrophobacteraceae bacterium]
MLDDELDAVVLIKRILQRKGHEISVFTEEEEAIAFARSQPVDLAILDMKLKRMNGIEILETLKKANPATRVMMLTGFPSPETAKKAAELGAVQYCVKPIEIDELEEKVRLILGNRSAAPSILI